MSVKIATGPNAGYSTDIKMRDDGYSRSDDLDGKPELADPGFLTNDVPGLMGLDNSDDIDCSFTAEQIVIDTCNKNVEVAKKGPHTATAKGVTPRTFTGVPTTL
jgi:hypothetical protein